MSKPTIDFKLIPFRAEHAEDLADENTMTAAERKFLFNSHVHNLSVPGHGISVIRNGYLLGSGGVFPIWEGLGEAWVMPSNLVSSHKKMFVKLIRSNLEQMTEKFNFRRVQATARADLPKAQRFLEFLGFEREGLLKKYGPDGSDHILYAKIKR